MDKKPNQDRYNGPILRPVDVNSIYPNPVGSELHSPSQTTLVMNRDSANKTADRTIGIFTRILGLFIVLAPFLPFLTLWLMSISNQDNANRYVDATGWVHLAGIITLMNPVVIVVLIVYLIVGVGILLFKEWARIALIILTSISLLGFSVLFVTSLQEQSTHAYSSEVGAQQSRQLAISEEFTEGASSAQARDQARSNQDKRGVDNNTNINTKSTISNSDNKKLSDLFITLPIILIDVALLIFFTRPRVRRLFA